MEDENEPISIYALYIGDLNTITSDTVIVYCHGQMDHMDFYWPRAKLLANCGGKNRYGILMMDFRGFGLSEGTSSEKGMFADVAACMDWLKEKNVPESHIIMYGFSLGTAAATHVTAYHSYKPSKLVLESPFASADNIAQESTAINFSANFLFELTFNNAEKIKDVDHDFLWIHGTEDDYIAISNGEIVYRNHSGDYKEAWRVEGAKHGEDGVPQTLGTEKYLEILNNFIIRP